MERNTKIVRLYQELNRLKNIYEHEARRLYPNPYELGGIESDIEDILNELKELGCSIEENEEDED